MFPPRTPETHVLTELEPSHDFILGPNCRLGTGLGGSDENAVGKGQQNEEVTEDCRAIPNP